MRPIKKFIIFLGCALGFVFTLIHLEVLDRPVTLVPQQQAPQIHRTPAQNNAFDWRQYQEHYPASRFAALPPPAQKRLPRVQYSFDNDESPSHAADRESRRNAVRAAFQRCWKSYHDYAWFHDELGPLSGNANNPLGGWAATLIDSLDTLWIMGLRDEFQVAVDAAVRINFASTNRDFVDFFDTTARYLGGLLSAYDLSGDERLLSKSLDLADMLYAAFDTPNRMPVLHWNPSEAADSRLRQVASNNVQLAEIGSLSLEFTRLSQITQDPKWYDAVARIMTLFDKSQNSTKLQGMWPLTVNLRDRDFTSGTAFSFGAMSTSMYEYLPKMYALLGGSDQYARMHRGVVNAARNHAIFRPMSPENVDVRLTGTVLVNPNNDLEMYTYPEAQHQACFVGGMLALGGRLMNREEDVHLGRQLTDGCMWAYNLSPLGIMPERFTVLPCSDPAACNWDPNRWFEDVSSKSPIQDEQGVMFDAGRIIAHERLPPGVSSIPDRQYLLHSETIDSIFVLYRLTGDPILQDAAWTMFQNIQNHTSTALANAALMDVMNPSTPQYDSMESSWMAETLKYFYLTFSDPNFISLDDYVLNTKAHPFKRPEPSGWGHLLS